jgi:hypothetical protein
MFEWSLAELFKAGLHVRQRATRLSVGSRRVAINYSVGDCDSVLGIFGQSEASRPNASLTQCHADVWRNHEGRKTDRRLTII